MKAFVKRVAVIMCVTIFTGVFFSVQNVFAEENGRGSVDNNRTQISEITKKIVSMMGSNKLTDSKKNEVINLVTDKVESKLNTLPDSLPQEDSLDPDTYAQYVEGIFNKNIVNVNSFDTAIGALADVVGRWVYDNNHHSDQSTLVNNTWLTYSIYDFGFVRQGLINAIEFQILLHYGLNPVNPAPKGYEKETITVPAHQDNASQLTLTGYYKDQGSDTTIVAVGGFRGNGWPDPTSPDYGIETKMLEDFGYNVLLTEPRASGESEGQFITMGYYEKDDYAAFFNAELSKRPNQKIILYGGSMGASTALGSLKNSYGDYSPQVKAIVAIAGYKSIKFELATVLTSLKVDETTIDSILKDLETRYLIPRVHIDLENELPMEGVANTSIPKLLLHGDADTFGLPGNSQDLFEHAVGDKNELYYIPGGTHGNLFNVSNPENAQFIKEHIEQFFTENNLVPQQ